jgi:hypothetical protein
MDSVDGLIDFPIFSLPLPEGLVGYRPFLHLSRNVDLKEDDILLVNDKKAMVLKLIVDIKYNNEQVLIGLYGFSKSYSNYPKTDLSALYNKKTDYTFIKRILSSNNTEWLVNYNPIFTEVKEDKDHSQILVLRKVDRDFLDKFFRKYTTIKKGATFYRIPYYNSYFTPNYLQLTSISNEEDEFTCKESLKLLNLSNDQDPSSHEYFKFMRLALGFSITGPLPLQTSERITESVVKSAKFMGLEDGLMYGQTYLIFNKEKLVEKKLNSK